MSQLGRGRIVWVELLDPQSRNPKCRPAVIISPDADIREGGEVWVVAISTQLDEAPIEAQVALPWDRRGHPRTGLKQRCAAVCTWMEKVRNPKGRFTELQTGSRLVDKTGPRRPPAEYRAISAVAW